MSDKLTVALTTTKKHIVHCSVLWCCFSYFGHFFCSVCVAKRHCSFYFVSKGIFQVIYLLIDKQHTHQFALNLTAFSAPA